MKNTKLLSVLFIGSFVLSGCSNYAAELEAERQENQRQMALVQQEYQNNNCQNFDYYFSTEDFTTKEQISNAPICLEIGKKIIKLSVEITGRVNIEQVTYLESYDDYQSITKQLLTNQIDIFQAKKMYSYVTAKSRESATEKIERSNQLWAQGMANSRRDLENIQQQRQQILDNHIRNSQQQIQNSQQIIQNNQQQILNNQPKTTNCTRLVNGDVSCTTY